MFDRGYLTVDDRMRLGVSPRLRDEFGNGEWFYAGDGQAIRAPPHRAHRPNRGFLQWHRDEILLAS
jgi:putative restriction endonuclease